MEHGDSFGYTVLLVPVHHFPQPRGRSPARRAGFPLERLFEPPAAVRQT